MFHHIGFASCLDKTAPKEPPATTAAGKNEPVKSVVRVHFPTRNMTLSYYNDSFNLTHEAHSLLIKDAVLRLIYIAVFIDTMS